MTEPINRQSSIYWFPLEILGPPTLAMLLANILEQN